MHAVILQVYLMLSRTKTVLSLMLLAGVCLVMLQGPHLRFPDEVDYDQLAQSILAGNDFSHHDLDKSTLKGRLTWLSFRLRVNVLAPAYQTAKFCSRVREGVRTALGWCASLTKCR